LRWLPLLFLVGCVHPAPYVAQVGTQQCQFERYLITCCDRGSCNYYATEPTVSRRENDVLRRQRDLLLKGIEEIVDDCDSCDDD